MNTSERKIATVLKGPISGYDILYCLSVRGVTQKEIADAAGVSPALVSYVIWGHRRNAGVARLIADKLETSPESLWGSAYQECELSQVAASSNAA